MKGSFIKAFFEAMFFTPSWYHYIVMVLLFPLSLLYGIVMLLRRLLTHQKHFAIPIISVGNIMVGGTGKTPFTIALASRYEGVTIISRGYGRQSKGLIEVSQKGQILSTVQESGDEAMLLAKSLPLASVIVSEDRILAIELAMREGAKLIVLDDGFSRVGIKKFEILLEPRCMANTLPFPAGAFREFAFTKKVADIVAQEDRDFHRKVAFTNLSSKMLLVTAISQPQRLDKYLPKGIVGKIYLDDHAYFDEAILSSQMKRFNARTLLVTQKDAIKMQNFTLPLSLMKLELAIEEHIFSSIDRYIEEDYFNVR
ncbi:MAG: tetraacyldisaccharide 4'-kinase [Sulfurovum sp.]|nr:tetraacyldisaccharide 4'-kinase [Sulfurovum sp.]